MSPLGLLVRQHTERQLSVTKILRYRVTTYQYRLEDFDMSIIMEKRSASTQ